MNKSVELFDGRNRWLTQGLSSRLFVTWSADRFYRRFSQSLYRSLLSHCTYRFHVDADPEDVWLELHCYFLEKTRKEQLAYDELVSETESYCHYPLERQFKTGGEVLSGVLSLYHLKMRDIVKNKSRRSVPISEEYADPRSFIAEEIDFADMSEKLARTLADHKELSDPRSLYAFMVFESLEGPVPRRLRAMGRWRILSDAVFRRVDYQLHTRILASILHNQTPLRKLLEPGNRASRLEFVRHLCSTWISLHRDQEQSP